MKMKPLILTTLLFAITSSTHAGIAKRENKDIKHRGFGGPNVSYDDDFYDTREEKMGYDGYNTGDVSGYNSSPISEESHQEKFISSVGVGTTLTADLGESDQNY